MPALKSSDLNSHATLRHARRCRRLQHRHCDDLAVVLLPPPLPLHHQVVSTATGAPALVDEM
jgi:hypothetical protein